MPRSDAGMGRTLIFVDGQGFVSETGYTLNWDDARVFTRRRHLIRRMDREYLLHKARVTTVVRVFVR